MGLGDEDCGRGEVWGVKIRPTWLGDSVSISIIEYEVAEKMHG